MKKFTLKDLINEYGTNLLDMELLEGTTIRLIMYGRVVEITVDDVSGISGPTGTLTVIG
jgi:hypothetical protein